ncbi:MAG: amidohydrolase [Eubacteriales bacterium]|nr:amidohydrolase [Eubacteriales bacterium]
MHADILIINGKCMTMKDGEIVEWIAIKDGKILDLGSGIDYKTIAGSSSVVIDAKGKTVLPGFIDSHFHVVQTAMNADSIDLKGVKDFSEIGCKIMHGEKNNSQESIFGVRLERENLLENNFPDRIELDKYCSNIPVWINCIDYQVSMLNTYGLLYYKVPFRMEGIDMDENNVATGVFRGKANATLRTNILNNFPNKRRRDCVNNLMPKLLSVGITTVNAMEGGYMYSDKDADFILEHQDEFPVDMALFYQSMDLDKINNLNLKRVGGSLYVDGTIGARTAALSFEYQDFPGKMGSLIYKQNELNEFVMECYNKRLQLALYAIGDRAIEMVLDAHEYALYHTGVVGLRHRIEHAVMANEEQIKRAAEMGIIFTMSPAYERSWGGVGKMYNKRLGSRYIETNMFREIIDLGVVLCGSSDSDVNDYNPFISIAAAVNHPVKEHSVSVYEALQMYTCNGAYAIFEEDKKGTLEKGKIADIIILDRDIMNVATEEIENTKVISTIKGGELLYNSPDV